MVTVLLSSDRLSIPSLNHLLDGDLCYNFVDFQIVSNFCFSVTILLNTFILFTPQLKNTPNDEITKNQVNKIK